MSTVQSFNSIGDFPFIPNRRTTAELDLIESSGGFSRVKDLTKDEALKLFWMKETVSYTINWEGYLFGTPYSTTFTARMAVPQHRVGSGSVQGDPWYPAGYRNYDLWRTWGFRDQYYKLDGTPVPFSILDLPGEYEGQVVPYIGFTSSEGFTLNFMLAQDPDSEGIPFFFNTDTEKYEFFFAVKIFGVELEWRDGFWYAYTSFNLRVDDYWLGYVGIDVPLFGQSMKLGSLGGLGIDSVNITANGETDYTIEG